MKKPTPSPASHELERIRQRLSKLRLVLLDLHKALVDSERVSYEKAVGQIQSPTHFLQLLTSDPWFAWLKPFSQLIVAMDETLEAKAPLTPANVDILLDTVKALQKRFGLTVIIIEHILKLVMDTCEIVSVLEHGEKIAEGTPDEIKGNHRVIEAYLGKEMKDEEVRAYMRSA